MADELNTTYDQRIAYLKDLTDFAGSDAAKEVLRALPALRAKYRDDALLGVHIAALADIAPRLVDAIALAMPAQHMAAIAPVVPAEGATDAKSEDQQPGS